MYFDDKNLIVQKDGDQGDSAGREGDYWFWYGLSESGPEDFDRVLNLLQVEPGIFVRHPDHYNDPKDFSRDQSMPLILAMGELQKYETLKLMLKNQLKRWFRYQNGDVGLFQDAGYYIRSFKAWYLYPFLLLGDIQLFINSIIRVIKSSDLNDVSDDINHTLALIQAQHHLPTPMSLLARKIYVYGVKGGVFSRWQKYFRPETNANPFDKLYSNLIGEM